MPANAQLRIVIHETAHALGVDYQTYTRQQAEVMVDTITYIVCAGLGLAIDGESIPYVAGWGEDGALEALQRLTAETCSLDGRLAALPELRQPACVGSSRYLSTARPSKRPAAPTWL